MELVDHRIQLVYKWSTRKKQRLEPLSQEVLAFVVVSMPHNLYMQKSFLLVTNIDLKIYT